MPYTYSFTSLHSGATEDDMPKSLPVYLEVMLDGKIDHGLSSSIGRVIVSYIR